MTDKKIDEANLALDAIRKKLVGKTLNYKEIYAIMDEIANERLGDILTTYFVASGYTKGFTSEELYFLTKAMVETGQKLHFPGIVADKHSIGGLPGSRVSLIVIPIIAAAGFTIPKSSSRAITTPAGTADAMEVLAKVTFPEKEIYHIVEKTRGCIVWGGSFRIAPADDEIIRIEEPLLFESFDKILVSVMAKKIAFGSTHVVIDLPYGPTVKVHNIKDAKVLGYKFEYLAKKFNIKIKIYINHADQPTGPGIGPLLEAREALKVLEQKPDRSSGLEKKALDLSSLLLDLCFKDTSSDFQKTIKTKYHTMRDWAADMLTSGAALSKLKEIIELQKGNPKITSSDLKPGPFSKDIAAEKSGTMIAVNNKNLTILAKILGAPNDKKAGIFLYKRLGNEIEKGETIMTFYSANKYNVHEAFDSLLQFPIFLLHAT